MIDWPMVEWEEEREEILGVDLKLATTQLPPDVIPAKGIGIDPGRNFGVAVVDPIGGIGIYYGYLHIDKDWSYAEDGWFAMHLVYELLQMEDCPELVAVEGAAHSMNKGQANLASIRQGFYMGSRACDFPTKMVAINTARKSSTGHGNVPMWNLLPDFNENAADALGLGLHASGYRAGDQPTLL